MRLTGGEREYKKRKAAEAAKEMEIVGGLARCSECGGRAKAVIFGIGGKGVWVGCDKRPECWRHIECHTEGWSLEECAEAWNKYNRGWRREIRKVKSWFRERIGEEARMERRAARARKKIENEEEEKRRERFGIKKQRRSIMRKILKRIKLKMGVKV